VHSLRVVIAQAALGTNDQLGVNPQHLAYKAPEDEETRQDDSSSFDHGWDAIRLPARVKIWN
jgi:hypothetical protein